MRTIMLMNAKGGCGKTTLATNLACWFADQDGKVALADYDPQGSSLDWLEARKEYTGIPEIQAIDATKDPVKANRGTEYLIVDVPAGVHGKEINDMLKRVDTVIIPVLPSAIDIRAVKRFLEELYSSGRISKKKTRVAIVANRVRENTVAFHQLEDFLNELKIPFLTSLRESQNYIKSAETGLSIFELAPSAVGKDLPQWDPIIDWLDSKASMPA